LQRKNFNFNKIQHDLFLSWIAPLVLCLNSHCLPDHILGVCSFAFYIYVHGHFQISNLDSIKERGKVGERDQVFPHHLLKRLSLLHWIAFAPLERLVIYISVGLFWVSQYCDLTLIYLFIRSSLPHYLDYCCSIVSLSRIVSATWLLFLL
jgi:hypothetical protein